MLLSSSEDPDLVQGRQQALTRGRTPVTRQCLQGAWGQEGVRGLDLAGRMPALMSVCALGMGRGGLRGTPAISILVRLITWESNTSP